MNVNITPKILLILALILPATAVDAKVVHRSITYQHEGQTLEGMLAYDDSTKGRRPAVLVVHEWWGLNDYVRKRADMLAELGYVAFALDMYGKGKETEHPQQAGEWSKAVSENLPFWRQRALAGLEILLNQPQTDRSRVAAIGYCFGGSTVQQLAYSGVDIKGVVSFHGGLQLPEASASAQVKAKMLICHGAADPTIKLQQIPDYLAAMERAGLDYQFIAYSGAKHAFTNPEADKKNLGALGYNRSADERSWKHMQLFFGEIFAAK